MSTSLRIEVRTGEAERKRVDFTPGTPVETFSVGTAASWVVRGQGVAQVHAYFYFDGTTLFVASVGGAPVTMAGRGVGTEWEPVDVPMNVHIGGVKLAVRGPTSHRTGEETQQRGQAPIPEEDEKTHFQPVPNSVRQGPRGAVLASGSAVPAARPPAIQALPDSEATVVQPPPGMEAPADSEATVVRAEMHAQRAPRPQAPAVELPPESERTRIAPVEARVPALTPAAGQPPPGMGAHPLAATQDPPTRRAPVGAGGAPLPAAGAPAIVGGPMAGPPGAPPMPAPGAPPPPGGMPGFVVQPGQGQGQGGMPGFVVQPGHAPGAAPGGVPPQPGSAKETALKLKAQAAKAWHEASIPQKAILVLLPFAFIAMFSLMGGGQSKKPAAKSAKSASTLASAAPAASAAPVAPARKPAVPAPAPAASSAAKPPATSPHKTRSKKGAKTPERLAVDAVAAGNYQEALKRYQALAAAHPERAVYQKAINILKQKIAQE